MLQKQISFVHMLAIFPWSHTHTIHTRICFKNEHIAFCHMLIIFSRSNTHTHIHTHIGFRNDHIAFCHMLIIFSRSHTYIHTHTYGSVDQQITSQKSCCSHRGSECSPQAYIHTYTHTYIHMAVWTSRSHRRNHSIPAEAECPPSRTAAGC